MLRKALIHDVIRHTPLPYINRSRSETNTVCMTNSLLRLIMKNNFSFAYSSTLVSFPCPLFAFLLPHYSSHPYEKFHYVLILRCFQFRIFSIHFTIVNTDISQREVSLIKWVALWLLKKKNFGIIKKNIKKTQD